MKKKVPLAMGLALALVLLFTPLASASVSININIQPKLLMVPGVSVHYAPDLAYNVFFYSGRWYVFTEGVWYYAMSYRGPWIFVPLVSVPRPVLLVPVDYYRVPLRAWHRGGPPPWARHRVEFREREERARREFDRERREHRQGRLDERREGGRQVPPAVQPRPREHRESRLQERREPQGQGHQELKGRREHQEGRLQERKQHESKGPPRGPEGRPKGHEGKGPREPERGGGERHEGRQEERR